MAQSTTVKSGVRKSLVGWVLGNLHPSDMRNIILTKKNDVHLVVDDEDVRDLGEHFTFSVLVLNLYAYRSRHWDGKIRLFSYTNGQIYTGLYLTY